MVYVHSALRESRGVCRLHTSARKPDEKEGEHNDNGESLSHRRERNVLGLISRCEDWNQAFKRVDYSFAARQDDGAIKKERKKGEKTRREQRGKPRKEILEMSLRGRSQAVLLFNLPGSVMLRVFARGFSGDSHISFFPSLHFFAAS